MTDTDTDTDNARPATPALPADDGWDDLTLPCWLPELVVTPDAMQLFMFSAVTWNRHHIHYSRDAAVREGLPDTPVHRALLGNYFARMLGRWAGHDAALCELSWKVHRSAFPGRPLRVLGQAEAREMRGNGSHVRISLTMLDDRGETVASGTALLAPPRTT
jgi:acyl dehydratase